MAIVLENRQLSRDFFLLRAAQANTARMGQFYMVRAWEHYPVLSRPISVFDADSNEISLLYKVVGEGTALLAKLRPEEPVVLEGPYGNGFPTVAGRIALVGGGVGIAPLYLAAKTLRAASAANRLDLFLGFSDTALLQEQYAAVCDRLTVDVGGLITERVDPAGYDHIFTCGPDAMMRALHRRCAAAGTPLYVSLENRMACGLGACLVCSCKTTGGNRKVCLDGPVFDAGTVYASNGTN